jgi:hypothetical protein
LAFWDPKNVRLPIRFWLKVHYIVMDRHPKPDRQPQCLWWASAVGRRFIVDLRSAFVICFCSPPR